MIKKANTFCQYALVLIAGLTIGLVASECQPRHDKLTACEQLFMKSVR